VTHALEAGTLFVASGDDGPSIIATVTLQWSDETFWGMQSDGAGYVHRLVVRRDRAGAGHGSALIDWAAQQVRSRGFARLRLDVAADNLPLCAYYERLGFEYQGDTEGDFTKRDGTVRHWRTRLYERACGVT
jgi:ribosomal protein S18 acetylase RimI-like enzyme